mmetsp:Transcript_132570/g.322066  ORF Transcript_132570/g.322066 Transcript_132570/m.322066 type:complete len:302 (-) Transcript_132570:712-1617(-)
MLHAGHRRELLPGLPQQRGLGHHLGEAPGQDRQALLLGALQPQRLRGLVLAGRAVGAARLGAVLRLRHAAERLPLHAPAAHDAAHAPQPEDRGGPGDHRGALFHFGHHEVRLHHDGREPHGGLRVGHDREEGDGVALLRRRSRCGGVLALGAEERQGRLLRARRRARPSVHLPPRALLGHDDPDHGRLWRHHAPAPLRVRRLHALHADCRLRLGIHRRFRGLSPVADRPRQRALQAAHGPAERADGPAQPLAEAAGQAPGLHGRGQGRRTGPHAAAAAGGADLQRTAARGGPPDTGHADLA